MNVIHLEDDERIRDLVARSLSGLNQIHGYETFKLTQVVSEDEFWVAFGQVAPALVILDAEIGDRLVGPSVYTRLREQEHYRGQVLALSSDPMHWERIRKNANFGHLAKPVTRNILIQRVLAVLRPEI